MAAEANLPSCGRADIAAISAIVLVSCARILAMIRTGVNQKASALTILSPNSNSDPNIRQERRVGFSPHYWDQVLNFTETVTFFLHFFVFLQTVSPSIFLDHLPWRCHKALKELLRVPSRQFQPEGLQMV
nr:sn1-specific diacylglycerol lipase beta isoform X3 [Ipomoea batatas]GMD70268.1 sn1-specific diacylglycerol lipase beta isoform X3 [Ipomoea batatas]